MLTADNSTRRAPAFFVRACEKTSAARAAAVLTPAPRPATPRARRRFGLILDATRRGGLRAVTVFEVERLESLNASAVREVRADREHYLPWSRLAASPASAREKIRAHLAARASALRAS